MRWVWIQKTMKAKLNCEHHHHHHHHIVIMREIFLRGFHKMPGAIHRASSDSKSCKPRQSVVRSVYRPLTSFLAGWFSHTFLLLTIWRRRMIILMIIVMMIISMNIVMTWRWLRWWWWWSIFYIHLITASHYSISVTRFIPWIYIVNIIIYVIYNIIVKRSSFLKLLCISAHCSLHIHNDFRIKSSILRTLNVLFPCHHRESSTGTNNHFFPVPPPVISSSKPWHSIIIIITMP